LTTSRRDRRVQQHVAPGALSKDGNPILDAQLEVQRPRPAP
jgi:hypothetical protein